MFIFAPFVIAAAAFETWNRTIFLWSDLLPRETPADHQPLATPVQPLASGDHASAATAPQSPAPVVIDLNEPLAA